MSSSKSRISKKESKSVNSNGPTEKKTTSDYYGIWSLVVRILLACALAGLLLNIVALMFVCAFDKEKPCNWLYWLSAAFYLFVVIYGFWGICVESFWAILGVAFTLLYWVGYISSVGSVASGIYAFFDFLVACIYAYMIYKSGLPLSGSGACCSCPCCIC